MPKIIVVVDGSEQCEAFPAEALCFDDYLAQYPKKNEANLRVINLCDTDKYLSRGYYCSLLAEARNHKVLPTLTTINDLREAEPVSGAQFYLPWLPPHWRQDEMEDSGPIELLVFLGCSEDVAWQRAASEAFKRFPAPLLVVSISRSSKGIVCKLRRLAYSSLNNQQQQLFCKQLEAFNRVPWRRPRESKVGRWDMAILVNPDEAMPPSNPAAISRLVKAASKLGISAKALSVEQLGDLAQYDALFIRETTAIDHHTFNLARQAEQVGLVVIDDATSILRCCNKVYLHDAFSYKSVPSLATYIVSSSDEGALDFLESKLAYPLVLKMPEGSFSRGVYKVSNRSELIKQLNSLLLESTLALAQEYCYTDFDWRIGVLNGRALYACRYYMARGHWQIYNHQNSASSSGAFETVPTFEVPKTVLAAALKAASVVGNGLYGVDVKQKGRNAFVIEVNDNPNIDHKIEDLYLGDELYMQIMGEFSRRLEKRGRHRVG